MLFNEHNEIMIPFRLNKILHNLATLYFNKLKTEF